MPSPPGRARASVVGFGYFCSFSFKSEKHCARFGPQMFVALVRTRARSFRVHFSEILWCLRRERGEATGRLHLHAVIAGLPPSAGARNCVALMSQWESLGGGMARVSVYNSSLDGLDYILKGSGLTESKATRWAGDYHDLSKFGGSCGVLTLSERCLPTTCATGIRSGWRGGIAGHETRGTGTRRRAQCEAE